MLTVETIRKIAVKYLTIALVHPVKSVGVLCNIVLLQGYTVLSLLLPNFGI